MRTAGIIGGLGPETTSEFYLEIIFSSFQKNKIQRPPLLIWSIPLQYQVERDLIIKAEGINKYIPYLQDAAKRLENGGADFLVIPCNSAHILIQEVRKVVKIPVLSIVEETSKFLKDNKIKSIGLLATAATINSQLYQLPLKNNHITVNLPSKNDQNKVGHLISNLIVSKYDEADRRELLTIIKKFSNKNIVLACTDLQLLTPKINDINIFDSMKILADATVREILT